MTIRRTAARQPPLAEGRLTTGVNFRAPPLSFRAAAHCFSSIGGRKKKLEAGSTSRSAMGESSEISFKDITDRRAEYRRARNAALYPITNRRTINAFARRSEIDPEVIPSNLTSLNIAPTSYRPPSPVTYK